MNREQTISSRLWRAYFNGPLYVPEEGRHVLTYLESGGPERFTEELERLAALGSPWAAAILGYLHLMRGSDGKRNPDRAVALCESTAKAGDPYALFVYAWALIYKGDWAGAHDALQRAIRLGFSPAAIAFADMAWIGWGIKPRPPPSSALPALNVASRLGHKAAIIFRFRYYRSGRLGIARLLVGYMLAPLAYVPCALAMSRDPFSEQVFVFHGHKSKPLLLPKPRVALSKS